MKKGSTSQRDFFADGMHTTGHPQAMQLTATRRESINNSCSLHLLARLRPLNLPARLHYPDTAPTISVPPIAQIVEQQLQHHPVHIIYAVAAQVGLQAAERPAAGV